MNENNVTKYDLNYLETKIKYDLEALQRQREYDYEFLKSKIELAKYDVYIRLWYVGLIGYFLFFILLILLEKKVP